MSKVFKRFTQFNSRAKLWQIFLCIMVLVVISSLIDMGSYYNKGVDLLKEKTGIKLPYTKDIPFHLGLDLQSGSSLVYQADMSSIPDSERKDALEGVRDVIERRVNAYGVSEATVQTSVSGDDYRIIIELPGVENVEEAVKMIGETPLLEFKEASTGPAQLTEAQQKEISDYNATAQKKAEEILGKVLSNGDFNALARQYSEDEITKEKGGNLGWIVKNTPQNSAIIRNVENFKNGTTTQDLIQTAEGYEILKLNEKRVKKNELTDQEEKEINASHILICFKDAQQCQSNLSKEDALNKIKDLKTRVTPQNFGDIAVEFSTDPSAKTNKGDLGWFGKTGMMVPTFEEAAFKLQNGEISDVVETPFGYHLIYRKSDRSMEEYNIDRIFIKTKSANDYNVNGQNWKNTELTGKNLKRAVVQFNPNSGAPEVSLEFDGDGAKLFEEITGRNVGKQVAIFLDGYSISSPVVNEKITGGKAVISGKFNIQEAKILSQRLNAGALPVPIKLIQEQTIGASLGQASLEASLKAGLYGLLIVILFMLIVYRFPGLLADFALIIYGLLVLAVFKIWPVTLSLAGMAGFIMSIGIAVDANVLIFARLKEELAAGKTLNIAIRDAFTRAWPSIRDGNVSTLITCFILIQFSTSVVKGFAITLGLGVIVSMFTAIVVTRNFLLLASGAWLEKRMWLIGVKKKRIKHNDIN